MHILIVEDNERMRRLIISLVARLGGSTCDCSRGGEALQIYARFRPDFVLLDLDTEPAQAIAVMREFVRFDPSAQIIAVTAHDSPDLREAAQQAGARDFLLKDNLLELVTLIQV
jgi:CheY-like chemotaxis protein